MCELTDKERYLEIAAKYTPANVKVVPVVERWSYRGMAHLGRVDEEGFRLMEAPIPDNIGALWVYLHECMHFRLHGNGIPDEGNNISRGEAEANLEVMRIMTEEGTSVPLDVLEEQYSAFMTHVESDDHRSERHPLCTQCITEFVNRIAPDLD